LGPGEVLVKDEVGEEWNREGAGGTLRDFGAKSANASHYKTPSKVNNKTFTAQQNSSISNTKMPRKPKYVEEEEEEEEELENLEGDEEEEDSDADLRPLEKDDLPVVEPYKVLDIEKTATADEIKLAYRKAALKNHPGTSITLHLSLLIPSVMVGPNSSIRIEAGAFLSLTSVCTAAKLPL
jgi:hypothetical protein